MAVNTRADGLSIVRNITDTAAKPWDCYDNRPMWYKFTNLGINLSFLIMISALYCTVAYALTRSGSGLERMEKHLKKRRRSARYAVYSTSRPPSLLLGCCFWTVL